jgi:hypothetical protein
MYCLKVKSYLTFCKGFQVSILTLSFRRLIWTWENICWTSGSSFKYCIRDKQLALVILSLNSLLYWSRIHEHTISLGFLGMILRVLRLEFSVYNFYITTQFQTTFARGGDPLVQMTLNSKEENFFPNYVQEFDLCTQ